MKYVLNAQQMRMADHAAIREIGIPSMVLMERAAWAVAVEAKKLLEASGEYADASHFILAVCGSGNNGGDGFATARILREMGYPAEAVFVGNPEHMTQECAAQREIFLRTGGRVISGGEAGDFSGADLIIDAIFGIGLSRDVEGAYAGIIRRINEAPAAVISADIPSGISSDTGAVKGIAVKADVTVSFAALKYGHLLYPGADYCGKVVTAPIGIPIKDRDAAFCPEAGDIAAMLPERPAHSNKGTFGKTLLISGREGMAGAAVLAGEAAYRTGTGIVTVCSAAANRIPIQTRLPEAIFTPWEKRESLIVALGGCSSAVLGPGLGTDADAQEILQMVFGTCTKPLVADADALNVIAANGVPEHACALIITPHPGEMARLTGCSVKEICADPVGYAASYARENQLICVLKDAVTVITDGKSISLCHTGCSGMATGGSGDVLAGMVGSLLAQGMPPFEAAVAGVWLHGCAGTKAAKTLGESGMLSSDIIRAIPQVLRELYR